MNKIFKISFSLKNTYRANCVLYAIKQIPILRKVLPESVYKIRDLKILANVIAALWEVATAFLGKLFYFAIIIFGLSQFYRNVPQNQVFLHILLFLTIIGAFLNTGIFNPKKDKYYAIMLLRMNAKEYTLTNYGYSMLKVIVGILPFSVIFGVLERVPLWICLIIPFCVAGAKLFTAACLLRRYEHNGFVYNENAPSKFIWAAIVILLCAAYGLPAIGIALPLYVSVFIMLAFILAGVISVRKLISFPYYREINQQLYSQMKYQMDAAKQVNKKSTEKIITDGTFVTSKRKGFEYLNELFVKRHRKILWRSSAKITLVCVGLICAALIFLNYFPSIKAEANYAVLNYFPFFAFVMYIINRGTGFTKALFMNCDHSLLTYSFYKQPKFILKLFTIRLREIIKINLLPAVVIGAGLPAILFASGGTDNPLNYAVLTVSIICMSVFFSIHYLTIYYLLQPYNAGTEIKSGTYQIIMSGTYVVCWFLLNLEIPTLMFGVMTIVFCVVYCIAACILVYKFAPSTFRIRY